MKRFAWFAFTAVAAATSALAQTEAVPAKAVAAELPQVVVTAQKRLQGANEVGMSISTISGDDLRERGAVNVGDLVSSLPGMTYVESFTGLPIITLRGMGNDDVLSLQNSPTVGIYSDQIVLPYAFLARGAQFDLERVEILKGPQGTLYGVSTTGGLINYITRKPTLAFESGGSVGLGSDRAWNADAFVSGPLSDTLRGRFSVMTRQGGDWQRKMSSGEKHGGKDLTALRGQIEYGAGDLNALLVLNYWRDHSDAVAAQPAGLNLVRPSSPAAKRITFNEIANDGRDAEWSSTALMGADNPAAARGFVLRQESASASATLGWKLSEQLTLSSLSNATHLTRDDVLPIVPLPNEQSDIWSKGGIDVFSQELRLAGKSARLDWVAGVFYLKDKVKDHQLLYTRDSTALEVVSGVVDANSIFNDTTQRTTNKALFGQAEYRLAADWKGTVGLRLNSDKKEFNGCTGDSGDGTMAAFLNTALAAALKGSKPFKAGQCASSKLVNGLPTPGRVQDSLEETTTSGRLGLDWQPDRSALVYANVSRGVKAGAFPTLTASAQEQFKPVRAETVTGYELGSKLMLLGRRAQLNASIFHYDYRDKQVRTFTGDPLFGPVVQFVNIPKSRVQGAEIDATVRASQALTLAAKLSYTDAKVLEYIGLDRTLAKVDFAGASFPMTPKGQATLSADYRFPLGGFGTVLLGADMMYASASKGTGTFILSNPAWAVPSRNLVDLRFGLRPHEGNWSVFGSIKNATNRYYWTDARQNIDQNTRYAGRPRSLSINLAYEL